DIAVWLPLLLYDNVYFDNLRIQELEVKYRCWSVSQDMCEDEEVEQWIGPRTQRGRSERTVPPTTSRPSRAMSAATHRRLCRIGAQPSFIRPPSQSCSPPPPRRASLLSRSQASSAGSSPAHFRIRTTFHLLRQRCQLRVHALVRGRWSSARGAQDSATPRERAAAARGVDARVVDRGTVSERANLDKPDLGALKLAFRDPDIRAFAVEPPSATRRLKTSSPQKPPADVATQHRMPEEPPGGAGWLHRKHSIKVLRGRLHEGGVCEPVKKL
ncbi:hypothetical protein K438DRAFT_2044601, partial [Mycena galopus ATCC 62051]